MSMAIFQYLDPCQALKNNFSKKCQNRCQIFLNEDYFTENFIKIDPVLFELQQVVLSPLMTRIKILKKLYYISNEKP